LSRGGPGLPVDPARLKAQFPSLTDDDLQAYVEVTRRILANAPEDRARITRDTVTLGRAAREKQTGGQPLTAKEEGALRYLAAVDKMQARSQT
jgi:hypothetical protein